MCGFFCAFLQNSKRKCSHFLLCLLICHIFASRGFQQIWLFVTEKFTEISMTLCQEKCIARKTLKMCYSSFARIWRKSLPENLNKSVFNQERKVKRRKLYENLFKKLKIPFQSFSTKSAFICPKTSLGKFLESGPSEGLRWSIRQLGAEKYILLEIIRNTGSNRSKRSNTRALPVRRLVRKCL